MNPSKINSIRRIINKRNSFWKILGILGSVGSIVGAIMGIYFYQVARKERIPTLIFHPIKTELLKKDNIDKSPISVFLKSGKPLNSNLISTTFYFFNQGKESIKSVNVLEPLLITPQDRNVSIVDINMIKVSRSVTGIVLKHDTVSNSLNISLSILEQNDGVAAQIIYEGGDMNTIFEMSGVIEGAKNIANKIEFDFKVLLHEPTFYFALFYLVLFVIALYLFYKYGTSWLVKRYLLIIRSEENFAEKSTISITNAKMILVAFTLSLSLTLLGILFGFFYKETMKERTSPPINMEFIMK